MHAWGRARQALQECVRVLHAVIEISKTHRRGAHRRDGAVRVPPWLRFWARGSQWIGELQRERARARQIIQDKRRAKRRALTLLLKLLNPSQREDYRKRGYFHVTGGASGDCYRIRADPFANIDVLDPSLRVRHRLCAQPTGDVPVFDMMAAQMLHLQDPIAEARFLGIAIIHAVRPEDYCRTVA
jgi:hypothetical protein